MLQDRKNCSGPRLCGTTLGSPLVLRTRAETWVFPHNQRPLVFFLSLNGQGRLSRSLVVRMSMVNTVTYNVTTLFGQSVDHSLVTNQKLCSKYRLGLHKLNTC